ncbi:MAG: hypothetical protein WC222_00880 [Parachlamydiales bacterium]
MTNHRILVIDDNESIHSDFKKILTPSVNPSTELLQEMNAKLFEEEAIEKPALPPFIIDSSYQGDDGVSLVRSSIEKSKPYAVAFVDILMPPGKDGIETINEIWDLDSEIQTVICTAYNKYSWGEIINRLGESDRLFILKKPFDPIEIIQLASSLTKRWNLNRAIQNEFSALKRMPKKENTDMKKSLDTLESAVNHLKTVNEKLNKQIRRQF